MEILYQIFELCIVPLLGILTAYIVSYIRAKTNELTEISQNDTLDKYLNMLVETLKEQGKFDAEAQKTAFTMTLNAVMNIMGEEAILYLNEACGDLSLYISNLIEAEVKSQKVG